METNELHNQPCYLINSMHIKLPTHDMTWLTNYIVYRYMCENLYLLDALYEFIN